MADADGLVAALGVAGTLPEVAAAAGLVLAAVLGTDIEAVRSAVTEFESVVRAVAGRTGDARTTREEA